MFGSAEYSQYIVKGKSVITSYSVFLILQIPKGFPYFAVDFGLQGGFAHVIEEERSFPPYFGRVCRHFTKL